MTVVLAVPCAEGVVLASDAQATDVPGGNVLAAASGIATRFTVDKLYDLGSHIAWGGTGDAGAIQRLEIELRQLATEQLAQPIDQLRTAIRDIHLNFRQQLVAEAQRVATQPRSLAALYAGCSDGRTWILEVTEDGKDTTYEAPYAIGSGGPFANLAMASVTHFDLPKRSLAEAQVIAWRALDGCIAASAFGIGHPIRMFNVTSTGARRVTAEEEQSLRDAVNIWKADELEALTRLGRGRETGAEAEVDEGIEPSHQPERDALAVAEEATGGAGNGSSADDH
jgi:20S proteasome alpha/beta subunit